MSISNQLDLADQFGGRMERVAIIGGAGFVGSALRRQFESEGRQSTVFDVNKSLGSGDVVFYDITKSNHGDLLHGYSSIINLAAVHQDNIRPISRYDEVNVEGAKQLCADAEKNDVEQIIFTSSVAVYGFAPPGTGEGGEISYFNDYGRTKYEAEKVYLDWQARDPGQRSLVIIRPTVIFGEGNRGNVYNLMRQIASRRFIMFGDGKNLKSMAYVGNVAAFISHSVSFGPGVHLHNYVDSPDMDMNALVGLARATIFGKSGVGLRLPGVIGGCVGCAFDILSIILRRSLPVSSMRVRKFMSDTSFSTNISKTGFVPPYDLSASLVETLKHEFTAV